MLQLRGLLCAAQGSGGTVAAALLAASQHQPHAGITTSGATVSEAEQETGGSRGAPLIWGPASAPLIQQPLVARGLQDLEQRAPGAGSSCS